MGDAFTCDRCGDVVEGHPDEVVHRNEVGNSGYEVREERATGDELCEDCAEKLEKFMDDSPLLVDLYTPAGAEFVGVATGDSSDSNTDDAGDRCGVALGARPENKVGFTMTINASPKPYNNEQPDIPGVWEDPNCTAY